MEFMSYYTKGLLTYCQHLSSYNGIQLSLEHALCVFWTDGEGRREPGTLQLKIMVAPKST